MMASLFVAGLSFENINRAPKLQRNKLFHFFQKIMLFTTAIRVPQGVIALLHSNKDAYRCNQIRALISSSAIFI